MGRKRKLGEPRRKRSVGQTYLQGSEPKCAAIDFRYNNAIRELLTVLSVTGFILGRGPS